MRWQEPKNLPRASPTVTPTDHGGLTFGLAGSF